MSKASVMAAGVPPEFHKQPRLGRFAFAVAIDGEMEVGFLSADGLEITVSKATPAAACQLGRWILDTFGENDARPA